MNRFTYCMVMALITSFFPPGLNYVVFREWDISLYFLAFVGFVGGFYHSDIMKFIKNLDFFR